MPASNVSARPLPVGASPSTVSAVVERLVEGFADYFPAASGPPAVASLALVPRRLSDIGRVTLSFPGGNADLYVKVHKKPTSPTERVRRKARLEFDTLQRLHPWFQGTPGYAVARPVAFFEEEMAVVTEAVRGENLHQLLKREGRGWPTAGVRQRLQGACAAAGTWLRHFQTATAEPRAAALPAAALDEQVTTELEVCVRMGLPRRDAAALLALLRARLGEATGREYPVVGEHPDFQPDNVLWSPETLTVIDFTSFRDGTHVSDVARFLASVAFLGKNPLYRGATLHGISRAFLEGYAWPRDRREPALDAYLVRYVVQAVKTASTWPLPAPVKRLVEWQAARFLTGWSRRLIAAGDGLAQIGMNPPPRRDPGPDVPDRHA